MMNLIVDYSVALAGVSFEFGSIENDDFPAAVANQACSL